MVARKIRAAVLAEEGKRPREVAFGCHEERTPGGLESGRVGEWETGQRRRAPRVTGPADAPRARRSNGSARAGIVVRARQPEGRHAARRVPRSPTRPLQLPVARRDRLARPATGGTPRGPPRPPLAHSPTPAPRRAPGSSSAPGNRRDATRPAASPTRPLPHSGFPSSAPGNRRDAARLAASPAPPLTHSRFSSSAAGNRRDAARRAASPTPPLPHSSFPDTVPSRARPPPSTRSRRRRARPRGARVG